MRSLLPFILYPACAGGPALLGTGYPGKHKKAIRNTSARYVNTYEIVKVLIPAHSAIRWAIFMLTNSGSIWYCR
jgi:hypothetical protein